MHSLDHHKFNIPTNEMLFSEAPVVPHRSWKNNKEKSYRSDNAYSSQEQTWYPNLTSQSQRSINCGNIKNGRSTWSTKRCKDPHK